MAIARLTTGSDQFSGRPDENNVFLATPDTLGPLDAITGAQSTSFYDVMAFTTGGTIAGAQFSGVSALEVLLLSDNGNAVTLTNDLVAGTSRDVFEVIGAAGVDTVNASGVTNGIRIAFYAGSGADSFVGGNGNDYFEVTPAKLAFDTIVGGSGFDCLAFSMGGLIGSAALANVTGIEALLFSNSDTSITLTNASLAGSDVFSVLGGTGDDTVDASAITNGVRVAFYASAGNEAFRGGNGSDYVSIAAGQLTSADHIAGGANYDIIEFSTPGTVAVTAFTNVSGIDALILNDAGNTVTLTNGLVTNSDNGVLVVTGGGGNDSVDAGAVNSNRVVFIASGGNDSFTGGGGSDVALLAASDLAHDTFTGGAGFDILQLVLAGTIGASAFANVSGVDELFLTLPGNNITLNGVMVAASDNKVFVVYDEAGHNTVDASGATLGGRVVFNAPAGDHDTYTGGSGPDYFLFGGSNLNASDTLAGGAGTDFLVMTTAGNISAADLAHVSQMEVVQLQAGGSIALPDSLSNSGGLEADGTSAADTIDGSAVASYNITIKGGGGADTLRGGAGNDQIFLPDTNFAAINGNGGLDRIILTAAFDSHTFNLSSEVSKISNVEVISLESAAGVSLDVAPSDIPQINWSSKLLYVLGGSDDEVVVAGDGWTQLETNHTNLAVSSNHSFVHYHNVNGSDLYVDSLISFPIGTAGDLLFS